MKTSSIVNFESIKFEQIIVNDNQEIQPKNPDEENKSETPVDSKIKRFHDSRNLKIGKDLKIYSIKDETKGKNEEEITKMIESELNIKEDDASVWNKMVKAISQISISN